MAQIKTQAELRTQFNVSEKKHVLKNCNQGDVEYTIEYVNWLENLILEKENVCFICGGKTHQVCYDCTSKMCKPF